jgi:hypothetical protein
MRRVLAFVLLATALAPAPAQSTASQPTTLPAELSRVLQYVPDDTHLLVVVPSLERLVDGLTGFGKALGVEDLTKLTTADILEEPLGRHAGTLAARGPFVLALSAQQSEPLLLGLAGDVETLAATSKPTELADGVTQFELGERGFLAITREKVAVITRERTQFQRAFRSTGQQARRVSALPGSWLNQHHCLLLVDVPPWQEWLQQQLDTISQTAYMGMAAAGPEAETGLQFWKWFFEQFGKLVKETRSYAATLRVDERGVLFQDRVTVQPDGSVARYLKDVRPVQRDLLRGLPTGGALVFGAEWELPANTETLEELMLKAILRTDLLKDRVGDEKFEAAMARSAALHRKMPGYNGSFNVGGKGQGMQFAGVYLTAEGAAVMKDMREMFEICPDIMNAWGNLPSTTVKCDTEQVSGAEAQVYRFVFDRNSPAQPMLQAVYGEDATLYMAPHPEGVAYALGAREAAREMLARSLAKDAPQFSRDPRVLSLFETLTPHPQFCLLIDLPPLCKAIGTMVQELGVPFPPLDIGDQPGPLAGLALYLEPSAVRSEIFVPSAPLKRLIKAFEKATAGSGAE